ncbi:MAG: AbrB/MazE/SpoVT family DNA-binding domain-containing protein [Nitrososphaeraceae archaeon]
MQTTNKIEYRKIQAIVGDLSFSLVLPKQYVIDLGIGKGDFVKVHKEDNKIVVEKA